MRLSLVVVFLSLGATSCASIVSKSSYPVAVRSNPSGAAFVIHDEDGVEIHRGVTPATVTLDAGSSYFDREEYDVSFSLPGHPETSKRLEAKLDPWFFGNIIFGGLIGILIVDPITGAMFKLPDELMTDLSPATP